MSKTVLKWRSAEERPKNEQRVFCDTNNDWSEYPVIGTYYGDSEEVGTDHNEMDWCFVVRWLPLSELLAVIK